MVRTGRSPIRILLADSDDLARNALRVALDSDTRSVVAQAADAPQAVNLAPRCQPDVALIDAALPPDGGLAAMRALAAVVPAARAILLGQDDEDVDEGVQALALGAAGWLWRGIDLESLARAVDGVMSGEAAISRTMAARVAARLYAVSEDRSGMRPVRSPLTTREWEVLDMLKEGATTARIAEELVLSPETVHSHVQHIFRKLNAHSRAEAVEMAERAQPGSEAPG